MAQVAVTGIPFGGAGTFENGRFLYGFEIFTNLNEIRTVLTSDEYEVMTEFRYGTGGLEAKYQILKRMKERLVT